MKRQLSAVTKKKWQRVVTLVILKYWTQQRCILSHQGRRQRAAQSCEEVVPRLTAILWKTDSQERVGKRKKDTSHFSRFPFFSIRTQHETTVLAYDVFVAKLFDLFHFDIVFQNVIKILFYDPVLFPSVFTFYAWINNTKRALFTHSYKPV